MIVCCCPAVPPSSPPTPSLPPDRQPMLRAWHTDSTRLLPGPDATGYFQLLYAYTRALDEGANCSGREQRFGGYHGLILVGTNHYDTITTRCEPDPSQSHYHRDSQRARAGREASLPLRAASRSGDI